ncbi:MAG: D-tyrosyl-tRNA(Tyr) deacylase [Deltaproteobacteria bacterium]|nr:D-tyrosyl-tRNA(Tyr) deacylase [Deltaproteobacteria bacterium]
MKAVLQRVKEARVEVEGRRVGAIERGLLVLLGVAKGDADQEAKALAAKIAKLRLFEDEDGRFNLDIKAAGGAVLAVSQFTLLADTRKGRRPSFSQAAPPEQAEELYEEFMAALTREGLEVQAGVFGARMEVFLVNDGPVTLVLDTKG